MRGTPARKLLLLGGGILAVLLLVGIPSLGQGVTDPSGELAPNAECYGHHKQEGFRSMDLFPDVLSEVPKSQAFHFKLTIRNPWLHDLKDLQGYVNISDAPGLSFPGAKDPVNLRKEGPIAATPGQFTAAEIPFPVEANATSALLGLSGAAANVPAPGQVPTGRVPQTEEYRLKLASPDGKIVLGTDPTGSAAPTPSGNLNQAIAVNQDNLTRGGAGVWKATIFYRGASPQGGSFVFDATTFYNQSQSSELLLQGPPLLKPNDQYTFDFTVFAKDAAALQKMRYGGRGDAYHLHSDKNIQSDGKYDKWNTMEFQTGAALKVGTATTQGASVSLLEPVFRRWGQVLGFAGSFLIIPSLVFGGTFGRESVTWLNKSFGGPRTRVLFHNSMSFWLLGLSALHMFIFFYEAFWVWSAGLLWGGLALACMIGLGVTGAVQKRFVARWGFNRWRFVHFAMGVLVVLFTLIHMVADGSHFAAVRDLFGGAVDR